ncbi:NUDIX hydrolase [Primorskyibacter sp. S187A]|uniref:NUDIX hydrolase n=1 Tax=Primorskyibacter sp. S187A TaxID=3415130 RepID=UPI003C7B8B7B
MSKSDAQAQQIAALPVRWDKKGRLRVLMVTSRDTGRWVMPKGWLMDGKKPWHAAKIEALEEAGAVGFVSDQPIGTYHYKKRLSDGSKLRCEVTVYPMIVEKLKKRWKERKQRRRHWFSFSKAAKLVNERDLTDLLTKLAKKPEKLTVFEDDTQTTFSRAS